MLKRFTVDGDDVWVGEDDFDVVRQKFKENVQVDDLEGWQTLVHYDEASFLLKANEYFQSNDYVQAHEKLWAAASFSVKKYFLCMGVKLASHNAKKYAVKTMIDEARNLKLEFNDDYSMSAMLNVGWKTAERCHASFNELTSTSPEEWKDKHADVEDFVKALDDLNSNDAFKKSLLTSLLNPPTTLTCQHYTSSVRETFGSQNYKINHKIF